MIYNVNCELKLNKKDILVVLLRGVDAAKEVLSKRGKLHEFYGLKLIYCSLRFFDEPTTWKSMLDCLELYRQFPDLIVGV